jgi:uroporphyrinogen decarboxylase
VLDFTAELCYQYLESFIAAGVEIVSIADPSASGDLISRQQFQDFVLPHLKKVVTKLHQKGVFVCIHICGNITNRLDLIPESGTDLLSVDYKVDLSKAKELLGGKIAFAGNMNPVGIMQNATASEVAEACRECLEKTSSIPGYILMPGCDIPPGVPLKNIQAMVETAINN